LIPHDLHVVKQNET
jgi:hypothetical protein